MKTKKTTAIQLFFQHIIGFLLIPFTNKPKNKYPVDSTAYPPFIVLVENTSSNPVFNVELFGSNNILNKGVFDANGNLVYDSIIISSGMKDIVYKEILYHFCSMRFRVGMTYLQSVNQKQFFEILRIINKEITGEVSELSLTVTKDPYQHNTEVMAVNQDYTIDGLTKIIIPVLYPNTKIQYNFYPTVFELPKQNKAYCFFRSVSEYFKKPIDPRFEPKSKPLIIEVSNSTGKLIKNIDLFKSNDLQPNCFDGDIMNQEGVKIRSLTPNISYGEILRYINYNPQRIKSLYLRLAQGDKAQLTTTLSVTTRDSNGNVAMKGIVPSIDPYVAQSDVISIMKPILIDGYTKLTIMEVNPKTTIVFYVYPEKNGLFSPQI